MRHIFLLYLVVTFLLGVSWATAPSREELADCMLRYVDVNHDGCVTFEEVDLAKKTYLTWWQRMGATRTEKVMRDCDFDHDGCMTKQDVIASNKTCLATEERRQMFYDYVCKNAAKSIEKRS